MSDPPAPRGPAVLVDTHVHFHDLFEEGTFLDAAVENFRAGARARGMPAEATGTLILTEGADARHFERIRREAGARGSDPDTGGRTGAGGEEEPAEARRWRYRKTPEAEALVARRGGRRLWLVSGRQIATKEGLEVLALGTRREFEDGRSFRKTLDSVIASEAVAVVPWGFGKWWFGRGRRVSAALERRPPRSFFLGDNGGRPARFGSPRPFRRAAMKGLPVLPGSDPLPFPDHGRRAGSYGLVVPGGLDERRPASALRDRLRELPAGPEVFGERRSLAAFARDQFRMQVR